MGMKIFGVFDAYESRETEEKMCIFISNDYHREIHIKTYPIRKDNNNEYEIRIDAQHTLDETLEMSMSQGVKYLRSLFPNMFEVYSERDIIKKLENKK